MSLPDQTRLVDALSARLGDTTRIETHISFVLLAGDYAYKIKKAVRLEFVDLRAIERRRALCQEELRLNRRLAPALYLDVLPITGTPAAPMLGGDGEAIEWALRMRRFPQDGLWERLAARGALGPGDVDALAGVLGDFHAEVPAAAAGSPDGEPQAVRAPVRETLHALGTLARRPDERTALDALVRWEAAQFEALRPVFDARRRDGRVRECHGDLHLGNVARIDGATVPFDALEFDPALRWIDVINDVAFMAMDLQAHGLAALAHRFVDAWVARSGDVDGLRVLRYYAVYRALVRARVGALRAAPTAPDYLATATALSRRGEPVLMITHGVSGSGKTWMTQPLLEALGALRLRADVERKRLFGLPPLARGSGEVKARMYGPAASEATYARLCDAAATALGAGYPVILDATFLAACHRRRARELAASLGVRFVILDFQASAATLRDRVRRRAERADDASDADVGVLERQWRHAEPLDATERDEAFVVDAEAADDDAAIAARWAPLRRRLAGADRPAR